jgi:hypothetical protein
LATVLRAHRGVYLTAVITISLITGWSAQGYSLSKRQMPCYSNFKVTMEIPE